MSEQIQAAPAEAVEQLSAESQESIEQSPETQEAVAELQDQAKNGTPAEKAEAKKLLKSLKLKVDGREYEEELPFEIPDTDEARNYMTKQLQMSKMAAKRAQDYSNLERDVRSYVELLRKDPIAALSDPSIGVDVKQLAAKVIEKEIEDSKKSPEQLKAEELERKLKKIEEEREKEKKDLEQREQERIQAVELERLDAEMTQVLEKAEIPSNPYFIKRMADYMLMGLQDGINVRPADVLPLVREEFENDIQAMIKSLDDEKLEKMIGKDVFNRIRKKNVSKVKASNPKPSPHQGTKTEVKKEAGPKKSFKEFFGI